MRTTSVLAGLFFASLGAFPAYAASLNFTGTLDGNIIDTTGTFQPDVAPGTPVYVAFEFDPAFPGFFNFQHTGVSYRSFFSPQLVEVHFTIGDTTFVLPKELIASGQGNYENDEESSFGFECINNPDCYKHRIGVSASAQISGTNGSSGNIFFSAGFNTHDRAQPIAITGLGTVILALLDESGNTVTEISANFNLTDATLGGDIPLPASLPMMLAAIGGIGLLSCSASRNALRQSAKS